MRWALPAFALLLAAPARADDRAALRADVARAVERGVAFLRLAQNDDGGWNRRLSVRDSGSACDALATATVLHALAACGVPNDDPAVVRGLAWAAKHHGWYEPGRTCAAPAASALFVALARLDKDAHHGRIVALGRRLERAQNTAGWWNDRLQRSSLVRQPYATYATGAVLSALWEADQAGAYEVAPRVWERTYRRCASTQAPDGSWGEPWRYRATMTSLFGLAVSATRVGEDPTLATRRGLAALRGERKYHNVRIHVGCDLRMVADVATALFLPHAEWYEPRARDVLAKQGPTGGWDTPGLGSGYGTAVSLLFLTRGGGLSAPARPRATTPTRDERAAATEPAVDFPETVTATNLRAAFEAYLTTAADRRAALRPRFGTAGAAVLGFLVDRLADPELQVRTGAYELLAALAAPPPFDAAAGPGEREARHAAIAEWLKREGANLAWNAERGRFE